MEGSDAAAILARRAALIASALSSFTVVARVDAQVQAITEGPCASGAAPTDAAMAEANARFGLAVDLMTHGFFDQASVEARRAYERSPGEKIALLALDADLARGAFGEALALAELHERCFGATSAVTERREKARASTGHVNFRWEGMPDATIVLDGKVLSVEEASFGVRLAMGEHKAVLVFQGRNSEAKFTVVGGEDMTVQMASLPTTVPMPCLSPLRYDDQRTVVRMRAGVCAPFFAIHEEPYELTVGTGLHEEISWQVVDDVWLEANLLQALTLNEDRAYGLVGGGVEVQFQLSEPISAGFGFSAGGLITPPESERAAAFFGPALIPFSAAVGLFYAELRLPIWLSPVVGFEPKVEFTMFAPQLVIGLGGGVLFTGSSESY